MKILCIRQLVAKLLLFTILVCDGKRQKSKGASLMYPKDTVFWATDFFVHGCRNFLKNCPSYYKVQTICARSYNGEYRNFENYCTMQYENCNTWRNWRVYKRDTC